MRKYERIQKKEVRYETFMLDDARMVVVAFGTAARIAKGAVNRVREQGLKVGMFRPISLWPFPGAALAELGKRVKLFFVFEMNMGQMVEDVRISLGGDGNIHFYGRPGGIIPTPLEISRTISSQYMRKRF
jgi:2-oxoglutarate ferredoxin oxidoreductase subunit alpha